MLDLGQGDGQVSHTHDKKCNKRNLMVCDPGGRYAPSQPNPRLVQNLKQLVEHIGIAPLTTEQVQKALTDQRQQANVEQQLEYVEKG
jgi:hypothetical protein